MEYKVTIVIMCVIIVILCAALVNYKKKYDTQCKMHDHLLKTNTGQIEDLQKAYEKEFALSVHNFDTKEQYWYHLAALEAYDAVTEELKRIKKGKRTMSVDEVEKLLVMFQAYNEFDHIKEV